MKVTRIFPGTWMRCGIRRSSSLQSHLDGNNAGLDGVDLSPQMSELVSAYASQAPTSVSLQMLMKTGRGAGDFWNRTYHSSSNKRTSLFYPWGRLGPRVASERILIQMAAYLRHELPVRLAHRIQDLDQCPHMRDTEAVQAVKGIYVSSFVDLTNFTERIYNMDDERAFASLLASLYQKHAGVLVQMARGAYELREEIRRLEKQQRRSSYQMVAHDTNPLRDGRPASTEKTIPEHVVMTSFERMEECHQFLDRFYMSRIGIRFLAGQYLALRIPVTNSTNDTTATIQSATASPHQSPQFYVGMICQRTSPYECVQQAMNDASMMCRRTYGRCPKVIVTGRLDLTFPYIPTYLHYILLELLKNALRATMEQHRTSPIVPPVHVVIADGTENEDVVIKITDEGGGIPRSQMDKIWSYLYTTADPKIQERFIGVADQDHSKESPLAGLGYGLPISRSYCRYFGGELDLISMEGFGTDAFVHLKRLGDSKEPVPV